MLEIILRSIVALLNTIMGLFGLAHWLDRRMSESSTVGRSKMDDEAHDWREKILFSWWIASLLIVTFLGGCGWLLWSEFFRQ